MAKKFVERVKLGCLVCGQIILLRPKQVAAGEGKTCSRNCAHRLLGDKQKGKGNPRWIDDRSNNNYYWKKLQNSRYPERAKARAKVYKAVKSGKLWKPIACVGCRSVGEVFAHHHDYSKPLEVEWLCRPCHREQHGGNN